MEGTKIKSFYIETIDGKLELVTLDFQSKTDDNLETEAKSIVGAINEINRKDFKINLIDGEGKYSLVQITGEGGSYGSSDENPKKQSSATGRNAVAFGVQGESIGDCTLTAGYQAKALEKGCVAFGTGIAGRTSAEWIAYYWDSVNWKSNNYDGVGSLEEITGDVPEDYANKGILRIKKDIDGNATTDYKYYYVLGHSNCKYGSFLLNPSFAEGQGTKAKGMWSHAQGYVTVADADFADASGQQTKSHGHHGHAGGYSSTNNSPYGFAHGRRVETSEEVEGQVALGKFNAKDETAQFIVGIGKDGAPKNGFSVGNDYNNPSIKVGKTQLTEAKLKELINGEAIDLTEYKTKDVQINGTSIVQDGVANIPLASTTQHGLIKAGVSGGLYVTNGTAYIHSANNGEIDSRGTSYKPISPKNLDYAVMKALTEPKTHTWTEDEKSLARETLGAVSKTTTYNKNGLYGFNSQGERIYSLEMKPFAYYPVSFAPVGGTYGDSLADNQTGTVIVSVPQKPYEAANKKYVDDIAAKKVDEWNGASGGYYTLRARYQLADGSSKTNTIKAYGQPLKDTIPIYSVDNERFDNIVNTWSGYLLSLDPIRNYHVANKKYVDENKGTQLYRHNIILNLQWEEFMEYPLCNYELSFISTRKQPFQYVYEMFDKTDSILFGSMSLKEFEPEFDTDGKFVGAWHDRPICYANAFEDYGDYDSLYGCPIIFRKYSGDPINLMNILDFGYVEDGVFTIPTYTPIPL